MRKRERAGARPSAERQRRSGRSARAPAATPKSRVGSPSSRRELAETRDYLQSIQEQHEAANEELQASNEEVQSANEELQSINEELETSKEELESTNEELTTVNEEMANRNAELNRLNSDLTISRRRPQLADRAARTRPDHPPFQRRRPKNNSTCWPPTSAGRSGSIRHNLDVPGPRDSSLARSHRPACASSEREVQDKDGRWYSLRVRPYLTLDNKIDGAVLVLVDIDALKRSEQGHEARELAESTINAVRHPLLGTR